MNMKKIIYPLLIQLSLLGSFDSRAASQYFGPGVSADFIVPAGVEVVTIQATTGGGGGGGSCYGQGGSAGADGGLIQSFNVVPGTYLNIQTQTGGVGGCGGGGGGGGGSVWVTGTGINFVAYGSSGGNGSGGGCSGGCGGKGGDSSVAISW